MSAVDVLTGDRTRDAEVTFGMAEYDKLKAEQHSRIQHRDGLMYTTLASMAAVIAGTISLHTAAVLLLLPPVAIVLAWKYLAADEKISGIGQYIRTNLGPRLAALTGVEVEKVFGWEAEHRGGVYARVRSIVQVAVDLVAFCVLPLAGLVGFWVIGPCPAGLVLVSIVEALLLVCLGLLTWMATLGMAGLGWLVRIAAHVTEH